MDARIKRFQQEASQQGAGGAGKRYSAALRRLAAAIAQERSQEPLSRIARELGVSPVSLQRWVEQERPARFRPVQVQPQEEPVEPIPSAEAGLLLITPRGYRIKGLDVARLADLLRVLG
jgi:transposase-like protein